MESALKAEPVAVGIDEFDGLMAQLRWEALEPPLKPALRQASIKGVWFNKSKGVTVVRWQDNTVTKVKCQEGDKWNPEHGLAMCIAKKAFGNKGNYNDVFKKWLPEKGKSELCE